MHHLCGYVRALRHRAVDDPSRNITPSRSATLGPTTTMFVEYGRLNEAQRVRWLVPLGWLSGDDVPVKQE
jgi:hypothetical protein